MRGGGELTQRRSADAHPTHPTHFTRHSPLTIVTHPSQIPLGVQMFLASDEFATSCSER